MKKILVCLMFIMCWLVSVTAQINLCPLMRNKVKAEQYTADYSDEYKIPRMVYYVVYSNVTESYPRSSWHVELYQNTAKPWDYTYSGYDRGHMFPFNSSRTRQSGYESFDMVNVCPQTVSLNRGVWSSIESFEQRNCDPYSYVVTGPIIFRFDQSYINKRIFNSKSIL